MIAVIGVAWDIDNTLHFERWRAEAPGTDFTEFRLTHGGTHQTPWEAEALPRQITPGASRLREHQAAVQRHSDPEEVTFASGDTTFLARAQKRLARGMDRPGARNLRETFFGSLDKLRTEVGAAGARFVIALMPSKEELYGAEAFPAVLRPVEEVKAELAARQLPILDLYPALRELGLEKSPFYRTDIHLNELGNQIVADAIAGWIEAEQIFTTQSAAPDIAASGAD